MNFGILGPLFVRDGGCELLVSGPKTRTLLVMLLLRSNQRVTTEELSEAVWRGGPLPVSSDAALRNLVSRIRRAIGDRSAIRLSARLPGYSLRIGDGELDLQVFEARIRRARDAVIAKDWNLVNLEVDAALELWRGRPLTDVPDFTEGSMRVRQLHEHRLQLLEWQFEAESHLGRLRLHIPELSDLATAHPLREPFHGQLMLALDQAGRRADALSVYQQLRRSLVEELGVDPNASIRRIHEQILTNF